MDKIGVTSIGAILSVSLLLSGCGSKPSPDSSSSTSTSPATVEVTDASSDSTSGAAATDDSQEQQSAAADVQHQANLAAIHTYTKATSDINNEIADRLKEFNVLTTTPNPSDPQWEQEMRDGMKEVADLSIQGINITAPPSCSTLQALNVKGLWNINHYATQMPIALDNDDQQDTDNCANYLSQYVYYLQKQTEEAKILLTKTGGD